MRSWCFDSVATEVDGVTTYDREYGSAEFREVMRKLVGDGVYANPANNMQVVTDGGMSVKVMPGYCWVRGALGIVDEAEAFTLSASSGGRVDLIVARFDLSLSARDIHIEVVKGTEGSTAAPALTRNDSVYDIQLARVQIRANSVAILASDITDTRTNSSVCGIVTGVIDQIDATDLFAQYEGVFEAFMQQLENTLSGDVAGNLLTIINNHMEDTDNPHQTTPEQIGAQEKLTVQFADLAANDGASVTSVTFNVDRTARAYLVTIGFDPAAAATLLSALTEDLVNAVGMLASPTNTADSSFYFITKDATATRVSQYVRATCERASLGGANVLTVTNSKILMSARRVTVIEVH